VSNVMRLFGCFGEIRCPIYRIAKEN
jgi:hypothetical protein